MEVLGANQSRSEVSYGKSGSEARGKKKKNLHEMKVLCRKLPPTLNEDAFLDHLFPIPEHDYFYYVEADSSYEPETYSRAYFNFLTQQDVIDFTQRFDGYVFLDLKGNEFPAVVEFAPLQNIPKKDKNYKSINNTISLDSEYIKFLEDLENKVDDALFHPTPEQYLEEIENRDRHKETSTPLLEFLTKRKEYVGFKSGCAGDKHKEGVPKKKKERNLSVPILKNKPMEEKISTEAKKSKDSRKKRKVRLLRRLECESQDDTILQHKTIIRKFRSDGCDKKSEVEEDLLKSQNLLETRKDVKHRRSDRMASDLGNLGFSVNRAERLPVDTKDDSVILPLKCGEETVLDEKSKNNKKSVLVKERIKNKERPSLQIYRPGMGKFSSQTIKVAESLVGSESLQESVDSENGRHSRDCNRQKCLKPQKIYMTREYYRSGGGRNRRSDYKGND